MPTRQQLMERKKAVETAKKMKDSKVGSCLLRDNAMQDKLRDSHLSRLDNQLRRGQMHLEQKKKMFLKQLGQTQPNPTLIVIRPGALDDSETGSVVSSRSSIGKPGYMRPIKSRPKTPKLTTIDAFSRQPRQKLNIWEASRNDQPPRFRSRAFPSSRLTLEETTTLEHGVSLHRPADATFNSGLQQLDPRFKRLLEYPGTAPSEDGSDAASFDTTVFLTQMASTHDPRGHDPEKVKVVGIRTLSDREASAKGEKRKSKTTMKVPNIRHPGQKEKEPPSMNVFKKHSEIEYNRRLQDFQKITETRTEQMNRIKRQSGRLPSADAIEGALKLAAAQSSYF